MAHHELATTSPAAEMPPRFADQRPHVPAGPDGRWGAVSLWPGLKLWAAAPGSGAQGPTRQELVCLPRHLAGPVFSSPRGRGLRRGLRRASAYHLQSSFPE